MYCKTYFRYDWSATRRRVQSEQIYVEWCDDESENDCSKDSFVLMAKSDVTESFKVDRLSAKLFVRKLKITPSPPGTRTNSPTKDGKVFYNARGV